MTMKNEIQTTINELIKSFTKILLILILHTYSNKVGLTQFAYSLLLIENLKYTSLKLACYYYRRILLRI
jgi:hypothetical protein